MSRSDWALVAVAFVASFVGAALPGTLVWLLRNRPPKSDLPPRGGYASPPGPPSPLPKVEPGPAPGAPLVRQPQSRRRPPDSSTWLP